MAVWPRKAAEERKKRLSLRFLNTPQFANDFVNTNYLSVVGFSQINGMVDNPVIGTQLGRMIQFALEFYW
jgi:hypothetical protein